MGGCRCSYRNCTVRSDGKTHMFHYPVFDKVRCHQWLTNTKRLEYLNLKVSQLKNRVVCQHHFKPEHFMNFKMEKLTFDAVPTLDGPYCIGEKSDQDDPIIKTLITPEDIENENLSFQQKQANFSLKYSDFLTNPELVDVKLSSPKPDEDNTSLNVVDTLLKFKGYQKTQRISLPPKTKKPQQWPMLVVQPYCNNNRKQKTSISVNELQELEIAKTTQTIPPEDAKILSSLQTPVKGCLYTEKKIRILSEKTISEPISLVGKLELVNPSLVLQVPNKQKQTQQIFSNEQVGNVRSDNQDTESCINIFTHKNKNEVSEINEGTAQVIYNVDSIGEIQVNFNGDQFLNEPIKKYGHHKAADTLEFQIQIPEPLNIDNLKKCQFTSEIDFSKSAGNMSMQPELDIKDTENCKLALTKKNKNKVQKSAGVSMLKNTIPPERVAAIEEKRKFNMKLRDMIEFCLDEFDEHDKKTPDVENKKETAQIIIEEEDNTRKLRPVDGSQKFRGRREKKILSPKEAPINQEVGLHLSTEPRLPSIEEYNISSIEARLKRMEDVLLKKIEQNSERIIDLKKSIPPPSVTSKDTSLPTKFDEESHKRQLFKDMSKYLSPNAKNLVYEELFLNSPKYLENTIKTQEPEISNQPISKRRRRR